MVRRLKHSLLQGKAHIRAQSKEYGDFVVRYQHSSHLVLGLRLRVLLGQIVGVGNLIGQPMGIAWFTRLLHGACSIARAWHHTIP